jgi:hypothetical protein
MQKKKETHKRKLEMGKKEAMAAVSGCNDKEREHQEQNRSRKREPAIRLWRAMKQQQQRR